MKSGPAERRGFALRRAIRLKAVGITQLVVPPIQFQPYFAGSNRTSRSTSRNFNCQSRSHSRPRVLTSQRIPMSNRLLAGLTAQLRPDEPHRTSRQCFVGGFQWPHLWLESIRAWSWGIADPHGLLCLVPLVPFIFYLGIGLICWRTLRVVRRVVGTHR